MDHGRVRYLEAKRTVDERALDGRVRRALLDALPERPRVFEAGCGTGATVPRLLEWGIEPDRYVGVDRDAGVVAFARDVRPAELRRRGYDVAETTGAAGRAAETDPTAMGFRLGDATFEFRVGDALEAAGDHAGTVDLLVAQAFADLVPLADLLAAVEHALAPGGLAYLPITFDGGTVFQPDHPADDAVVAAYHDHIDATAGRDSRAGRHLAARLQDGTGTLLAMGASDWVVRPRVEARSTAVEGESEGDSRYPADEAHFLATILNFVEAALEERDESIDGADGWLATRRRQLRDGELLYVAHQYDLLYRAPE